MSNFALIGAAGFIAPRHMAAIQATGNQLVAALDPSDSVGVIDSYFPESAFFTEFERFDRHVDKLQRGGADERVDYVSICSPNYLHDAHIRFALRSAADAICEKPLVLNPWNIEGLAEAEARTGRKINTILQLRLHPSIVALRERIAAEPADAPKHEIDLTYITGRGQWYLHSWKGDEKKSGGIATNIGVHFFDMLHFVFGRLQESRVQLSEPTRASGYLEHERARIRWRNYSLFALAAIVVAILYPTSTALDRTLIYLFPLQIFVLSMIPYVSPRGTPVLPIAAILFYLGAILFVFLHFGVNAESYIPYQIYWPSSGGP